MSRKGFTLVEVLIVIVICAILAGLVFGLMMVVDNARVDATEIRVHGLGIEVGNWMLTKNAPPATLEELAKRLDQPGWMENGKFVDSWGKPFEYRVSGRKFELWSCGLDGVSGTPDDLRYKRN